MVKNRLHILWTIGHFTYIVVWLGETSCYTQLKLVGSTFSSGYFDHSSSCHCQWLLTTFPIPHTLKGPLIWLQYEVQLSILPTPNQCWCISESSSSHVSSSSPFCFSILTLYYKHIIYDLLTCPSMGCSGALLSKSPINWILHRMHFATENILHTYSIITLSLERAPCAVSLVYFGHCGYKM